MPSDCAALVGALSIPMIFNNVLNERLLDEAHAKCAFYDPYIGEEDSERPCHRAPTS
jgi:hypothetical protein